MDLTDVLAELPDPLAIADFALFCANQTLSVYQTAYPGDGRPQELVSAITALVAHPDDASYTDLHDAHMRTQEAARQLPQRTTELTGPIAAIRALNWAGVAFEDAYMYGETVRTDVAIEAASAAQCAQLAAGCAAAEGHLDATRMPTGNAAMADAYRAQLDYLVGHPVDPTELDTIIALLAEWPNSFADLVTTVHAAYMPQLVLT